MSHAHVTRARSPLNVLALLALTALGSGACRGDDTTAPGPRPAPSALLTAALDPALATPSTAPVQNLFGYVESLRLEEGNRMPAGGSLAATVTLDGTRIGPSTVTLSSSDPSIVTVPASVTVGVQQDAASFPVNAVAGAAGCAIITARVGSTPPKSKFVFVLPARVSSLVQLKLSPGTLSGFTFTTTATVDLLEPIGGDGVVMLSSSHPDVAVPASVTVPLVQQEGGILVGQLSLSIRYLAPRPSCAVITATKSGARSRVLLIAEPFPGSPSSELF